MKIIIFFLIEKYDFNFFLKKIKIKFVKSKIGLINRAIKKYIK